MIVTSGAVERHSKECFANLFDLLIDEIHLHDEFVGLDDVDIPQDQEADRRQLRLTFFDIPRRQQVAGELLSNELIKRLVVATRLDHVVSISPCVLGRNVIGRADLIGVAHQVQPRPCRSLSESRRCEQSIDDVLPR